MIKPPDAKILDALTQENALLRVQLAQVQQQLDWFKRQLFGSKSEKLKDVDPGVQADLFASLTGTPIPVAPPVVTEKIIKKSRQKLRDKTVTDTGLRFDDSVPRQVIDVVPVELQGAHAADYEIIAYKSTFRLAQRPGSHVVLEYRRPVFKHRETQVLVTTPAPFNVLDKSLADVSFLTGLLIDKFCYHLPFYRQHQRLQQGGVQLSRSTLIQLGQRAIELLRPIYLAQLTHILQSRVLAIDETPVKAGREEKGKLREAWFWPIYGEQDEIAFTYSTSRGMEHLQKLLGDDFSGTLLSDGHHAYARYAARRDQVIHAECWAHTRRHFEKAQPADPAATQALQLIAALYHQEQLIRERQYTGEDKQRHRTEHSEPLVKAFWHWCDQQCQRLDLTPTHPLAKALKYTLKRIDSLEVFLSDPAVQIDTNHLERNLRPIPMGKRTGCVCHEGYLMQSALRWHEISML